jgi:dTDP-4-amino-4,6-dideoxygalactose transaminase
MSALAAVPTRRRPALYGGAPLFREKLRFLTPSLPPLADVIHRYAPGYHHGMITNASCVARLEQAVAERAGVAHCVAVSSCTSGLMLVLKALDLSGEVILPSFTFFATGHAALWNGLTPVFADCDPHTWTLDPAAVERSITRRTAAIIGVHLYGNPCDVDALESIASRHNLPLIFDAAHAFGSRYQRRPIGRFGQAEVFSLSPTKPLIAGEGGLITTNDALLASRLRAARNYGDLGSYDPSLLGLNARMTEFNAALALAGLDQVSAKVARHNEIAQRYSDAFRGLPGVQLQRTRSGDTSTFKDYSICLDPSPGTRTRDELAQALLAENIETKQYFFPPLHWQSLYQSFCHRHLPETERVSSGILSLPIYQSLSDDDVGIVANAVVELLQS